MRKYECMVILRPDIDPSDTTKIEETVRKFFDSNAKFIKSFDHWGKRTLSYPIKKSNEGIYVLVKAQADEIKVSILQKKLKLTEDVLRFLLKVEA